MNAISRAPSSLKVEPLVEAICEIRFRSRLPVSRLLPGVLYEDFKGDALLAVAQLPAAELPSAMRANDANLRYVPVVEVRTSGGVVRLSDSSVLVSAPLPYRGWTQFHSFISKVMNVLFRVGPMDFVERIALKYVDFLRADYFRRIKLLDAIQFELKIGGLVMGGRSTEIKSEMKVDDLVHIIEICIGVMQIISRPEAANAQEHTRGLLLTID